MDYDEFKKLLGEELSKELEDFATTASEAGKTFLKDSLTAMSKAFQILAQANYLGWEERKKRAQALLDFQKAQLSALVSEQQIEAMTKAFSIVDKVLSIIFGLLIKGLTKV